MKKNVQFGITALLVYFYLGGIFYETHRGKRDGFVVMIFQVNSIELRRFFSTLPSSLRIERGAMNNKGLFSYFRSVS